MKFISKYWLVALTGLAVLSACDKADELSYYGNGTTPVLSSSVSALAAPPSDSNNTVITYSWTNPQYATDSSTAKYIIEIDSAGRNFAKASRKVVNGALSTSFTGKEINNILLSYGFQFGVAYNMEVRLVSSYGNNNEQYKSNVIAMKMTPYKIPPKIPVPSELIIVGDATLGGWNNPASDPAQAIAQRFSLIDETTYAGIFQLYGGAGYLMLPVSGDWSHKFGGESATGGTLLVDGAVPSSNTPTPAADGLYKIVVDFQNGTYTVTPFTQQHGLPDKLVAVGDATPVGWNNEVSNPQKFTRLNSVEWTQTISLSSSGSYLILPAPGDWGKKYGCNDQNNAANKLGGIIVPEGSNIPGPETGNYKINLNFATGMYKLTKL